MNGVNESYSCKYKGGEQKAHHRLKDAVWFLLISHGHLSDTEVKIGGAIADVVDWGNRHKSPKNREKYVYEIQSSGCKETAAKEFEKEGFTTITLYVKDYTFGISDRELDREVGIGILDDKLEEVVVI